MFLLRCQSSCRAAQVFRQGYGLIYHSVESACGVVEALGPTYRRDYAKLVSFPLAQTGEGISECELVSWAIKEGDVVSPFDKLCDVQSDKASIEITSRYGGRVVALRHAVGSVVKVGAPLVDLEVPDHEQVDPEHLATAAKGAASEPAGAAEGGPEAAAVEPAAPAGGLGTVVTISVGQVAAAAAAGVQAVAAAAAPRLVGAVVGAAAAPGVAAAPLAAAAADAPAAVGPTAAVGGAGAGDHVATPVLANAAATGPVPMTAASALDAAAAPPPPAPPLSLSVATGGGVHATPAVRALAKELGLDLAAVAGSGPGGRVTKADLLQHRQAAQQQRQAAEQERFGGGGGRGGGGDRLAAPAEAPGHGHGRPAHQRSLAEAMAEYQRLTAAAAMAPTAAAAAAEACGGAAPGGEVVPLRGYRRAMVRSMAAAASLPLFHLHDELHVGALLRLRAELRGDPGLRGVRLTLLPFILKALSVALSQHPQINASLSPGGDALLLQPHHNLGVAMATPSGLVVPNIKQVERKSIPALAAELSLLQQLAAAGRLPAEALAGGTLSVSNIGSIGGTYAAPIVSPPELAIVALGRTAVLPRYTRQQQQQLMQRYAAAHVEEADAEAGPGRGAPHPAPVPVPVMPVSWGADHRAVDGAALASFHNTWKALLEAPERLLLHTA